MVQTCELACTLPCDKWPCLSCNMFKVCTFSSVEKSKAVESFHSIGSHPAPWSDVVLWPFRHSCQQIFISFSLALTCEGVPALVLFAILFLNKCSKLHEFWSVWTDPCSPSHAHTIDCCVHFDSSGDRNWGLPLRMQWMGVDSHALHYWRSG